MKFSALIDQLVIDEGIRLKPYKDTVGKLTIGIGRNLDDVGITESEARTLLETDYYVPNSATAPTSPNGV